MDDASDTTLIRSILSLCFFSLLKVELVRTKRASMLIEGFVIQ